MRYVSIVLWLVASVASAEDWQQIAKLDSNGGVLLFDAAGVVEVKGYRGAWFKSVYSSDQPVPDEYLSAVPADFRTFRSEKSQRFFNCLARTGAVLRYSWRGSDDKEGGNFQQDNLTFHRPGEGTLDEQMLEAACNFTGELASSDASRSPPPESEARITRSAKVFDYYPPLSIRRNEQGAPTVRVCVDSSGKKLRKPEVTKSSGFPELDAAAIRVASDARYAAGTENGVALPESCIEYKVTFALWHGPGRPPS